MNLVWVILIGNTVTMLIVICAAIIRDSKLSPIAGMAVIAFVFSLHLAVTGGGGIYSLIFNALLIAVIFWCTALNLKGLRTKK